MRSTRIRLAAVLALAALALPTPALANLRNVSAIGAGAAEKRKSNRHAPWLSLWRTYGTTRLLPLFKQASYSTKPEEQDRRNILMTRLDQNVSADAKAELTPRWSQIERDAKRLHRWTNISGELRDGNKTAAALPGFIAFDEWVNQQALASNTLSYSRAGWRIKRGGTFKLETWADIEGDRQQEGSELKNWRRAFQHIAKWSANRKALSLERLAQLNFLCTGGALHANGHPAGVYRSQDLTLGDRLDRMYLGGADVRPAMIDFLKWYNANKDTMHPIELAARAYQRFVSIHPFNDGNGRTGRLMADWILMAHGLPPAMLNYELNNNRPTAVFGNKDFRPGENVVEVLVKTYTEAIENTIAHYKKYLPN